MSAVDTTIAVPPQWFLVGGAGQGDRGSLIDRALSERIQQEPELARVRGELSAALHDLGGDVDRLGAGFGGSRYEDDPRRGPVTGTLFVFRLERDAALSLDDELAKLGAMLGRGSPGDQYPPRIAVVDLPAGRAVRLVVVRSVVPEGAAGSVASAPMALVVQYWIPVPATGDLYELSFTTMNLLAADELTEEFEAIAWTFTVTVP